MDARIFPDINNFTERFNAHQVASGGALVVGILATDGVGFTSPTYAEQAQHAHGAGIPVWHYHFCRPEQDRLGVDETPHFWRVVKPHFHRGDRLVLDVERSHPQGLAQLRRYVHMLDERLHELSGIHQATYIPDSLFRALGPELQTRSGDFWIASWGGRVARLGHGRRMIAQQISNGQEGSQPFRYPGIGACDTNRLQRWYVRRLQRERRERSKGR
jgi:GH25 family lysozyme M1 (1,4-beta-N-acetylmuramidase)